MSANDLERQVIRARRRLWLNRWLRQLGWMATIGAGGFALTVIVDRLTHLGTNLPVAALAWAVAAIVGSLLWLIVSHEDRMGAALALDEAVGLRERVTTGLYCAGSDDPFARSVCADAARAAGRITVRRHLPVRYPQSFHWAGCTVLAALLLLWLMPSYDLMGLLARQRQEEEKRQKLETTQAAVQQVTEQLKQISRDEDVLKELKELDALAEMEPNMAMEPDKLRREAAKKIEELSERLKQRQESAQYDELDEFKKMMRRLRQEQRSESPVAELRKSLAQGDFQAATRAIEKLKEDLAKAQSADNKAQVQSMQQQLAKLAKEMDALANQKRLEDDLKRAGLSKKERQDLLENLSKRDLESMKKSLEKKGLSKEQVKKLMKQIAKSKGACSKCKGLAGSLAAAAAGMQGSGDTESGEAMAGLSDAAEQLSEMEMLEQEMMELEATVAGLNDCKSGLCQGPGQSPGQGGQGSGMGKLGQGRGNIAPREETKRNLKSERVTGKQSPGAVIGRMFIDGEQLKGEAREEAAEVAKAAAREATEAIDRDRVPRQYHRPLREYFGKVQEGIGQPKPEPKK